ncbi:Acid_phosphatase surE [Hexamita inflata]|uniref:Acid phosphatase surE n=1 Tax=Hexamita inflata TaxID=28002 RepID=A0AA86U983_9EUKA|nr:Acid phosphatase surE [Hexamita inflata]
MKIAVVNDDGYQEAGINCLIQVLQTQHEVRMIAPKQHQSGAAQSLTLGKKFEIISCPLGYIIDARPADCVRIGLQLLERDGFVPDLIVSGINTGSNLGADLHYSGTFGAAREAFMQGFRSIAFSNMNMTESLEDMKLRLSESILNIVHQSTPLHVMNVNFPRDSILGFKTVQTDSISFYTLDSKVIETDNGFEVVQFGLSEVKTFAENKDIFWCTKGFITISKVECDLQCVQVDCDIEQMETVD